MLDCLQICAPRTAQAALPWAIEALRAWREANRAEINRRAAAFRHALGTARRTGGSNRSAPISPICAIPSTA